MAKLIIITVSLKRRYSCLNTVLRASGKSMALFDCAKRLQVKSFKLSVLYLVYCFTTVYINVKKNLKGLLLFIFSCSTPENVEQMRIYYYSNKKQKILFSSCINFNCSNCTILFKNVRKKKTFLPIFYTNQNYK